MADFNNLALTVSGVKALLAAQTGTAITLTKIGMGSGSATNSTSLTNLVAPEVMLPISEKKINKDSGLVSIVAKMTNEDITEGFYWRETGLFFEDSEGNDVLFAYACVIDDQYDYVPAYSDKRYVKHVRIANIVTDSADITVKENEGLLYVDILTFEEYKEFVEEEFTKKANMITKATTVYVSTGGSDKNDGSEAAPLRTIQEAINRCPLITGIPAEDNSEMHYAISVAEGTYNEHLKVVGKKMTIETSGTVVLTALSISSVGQVALKGTFHFNNAGANCVTLYNSKLYCFGTIKVLAGSIGIILAEGSQVVARNGVIDINNTTWSGVQLGDAGVCYIEELTGAGNTGAGIRCAKAIMWTAINTLVTSGASILVTDGGIVNTGTLNTKDKTLFGAINEIYNIVLPNGLRNYVTRWEEHGGGSIVSGNLISLITSKIRNEKIYNGEFSVFNIQYTDGFPNCGPHGLVKYRKHLDDYVTVTMATENLGTNEYIARFVLGESTWRDDWKLNLTASDVVDNLLSTATNVPPSARQVKVLNESKAPNNHASTATTYGMATSENYGHVKLSGSVSNTSGKDGGVAATPSAVKNAYDRGTTAINNAKAISDRLAGIANVITNEQLSFSLASDPGTTSKNIFVAPASGIYFIDAYAIFAHNTNGNRFFSLGSVDLDGMTVAPASGNSTAIKLNTVVYMTEGQQFFVNVRQTSGSALNVTIKSRYSYLPL